MKITINKDQWWAIKRIVIGMLVLGAATTYFVIKYGNAITLL
jgi:hypothetical protein